MDNYYAQLTEEERKLLEETGIPWEQPKVTTFTASKDGSVICSGHVPENCDSEEQPVVYA